MRNLLLLTAITLTTLTLAGCTEATSPDPDDTLLAPPEPGKGVQFKMVAALEAGSESEKCMFVKAPAEDLMVQRDEVRYTPGSHHFLLYETAYTEIPTKKLDGKVVDTSGVFDCSDGATNGWDVTKLVGGSQNADGDSMLNFPDNVAMHVHGGAVLLMNAHYVNATSEVLEPEIRINLYTIPESQVEHEGDVIFFYNAFIAVPAQAQARARMRCTVHKDITLVNFQSHMHRLGVDYAASVMGESPFYENTFWEGVPVLDLGAGKPIKAGSVIDYHCDYKNPGSEDVFEGPRSTDEMCMAIGSYYPADPTTSNCGIPGVETPFGNLGADWVGNGEKTCAETMGCVQGAFGKEKTFDEITKCILDAAPEKAEVVSDAIRCLFTHKDPLTECKAELSTCQAN